jgi:predicted dehydrogenase
MPQKLKFAIIGAGSIAQIYAKAFAANVFAEVVAVVDVRAGAARELAADCNANAYESHSALLRAQDFDAALICTPPVTHCPIALDLMQHGKHVLCEKPLSVDVASAKRMLSTASECGITIAMGSKFRYVEDVIQAKRLMGSGLIGEVLSLENAFTSYVDMAARWNSDPAISGGGVIIDNGTHSVDIVRFLCGPIVSISASEAPRRQQLAVEETAQLVARTHRGVLASIHLSWSLNTLSDSYVRVCGSAGTIAVDWSGSKYRSIRGNRWVPFGKGYDKIQALSAQLDNFCRAIGGQEPLLLTPEDALASVEAVAAAYESLRSRRWVAVRAEDVVIPSPTLVAAGVQ